MFLLVSHKGAVREVSDCVDIYKNVGVISSRPLTSKTKTTHTFGVIINLRNDR